MNETRCNWCGITKPSDEFYRRKDGRVQVGCKACRSEYSKKKRAEDLEGARQRQREANARYAAAHPMGHRAGHLRRTYGITLADEQRMRDEQHDACAICLKTFTATPAVDHCHVTGNVRGLLCDFCNKGLGNFDDDEMRLRRAVNYLESWRARAVA